ADTFIVERNAEGEAVFRLAGTRLCAAYGGELKGLPLATLWRHQDRSLAATFTRQVFETGSALLAAYDGLSHGGRSVGFELLILPLDCGSESPRALGIASPAEKPFWLGADPIEGATIEAIRIL